MGSQVRPGQGNFMPPYGGGTINESTYNSGPYVQNPGMPSMGTGGGFAPGMGGGGIYPGAGPGVGWQPGMGGGLSGGGAGGSWNGPAPAGFTHPGGPSTMALEEFVNPATGQTWTASSGGYRPPPGWERADGGGMGGGGMTQPGFPSNPGMAPPAPAPAYNPFSGVSAGRLAEAQRFADMGKMGRAKQQVELGGGTWNRDMSRAFRSGGMGG